MKALSGTADPLRAVEGVGFDDPELALEFEPAGPAGPLLLEVDAPAVTTPFGFCVCEEDDVDAVVDPPEDDAPEVDDDAPERT